MNSIYNNPQEWLKKPLINRLEELRKLNTGANHAKKIK